MWQWVPAPINVFRLIMAAEKSKKRLAIPEELLVMTVSDQWTEILRCQSCAMTGVASLSQNSNGTVIINKLPAGFKAVSSEYGDTFYCKACNRPAGTSLK
jgi:hypothetical protein